MFENGAYVYSQKLHIALVWDDMAVGYSLGWYGDLAEWEISGDPNDPVDVGRCADIPNMMATAFGWHWEPYEEDIEFYPADEIPFDEGDFPLISELYPNRQSNVLRDDRPMLDWAFEIGLVN